MDDHTNDPHVSPQNPHPDDTHQGVAPVSPSPTPDHVGSMHKEAGPARVVEAPVSEVLTPSEKAPELPKEVEDAGVEVSKDHDGPPDLTMHDAKIIEHAPVIAPVPTQPSGMVTLPLTEEKATEVLKHKDTKSSLTWLAELVTRIHEKMKGGA